jgi:hypothetical protein
MVLDFWFMKSPSCDLLLLGVWSKTQIVTLSISFIKAGSGELTILDFWFVKSPSCDFLLLGIWYETEKCHPRLQALV